MLNDDMSILPCCPITGQPMKDPVSTPDGNTYEREAIERWLIDHNSEPQTRNILNRNQLIPNRVLREMYQKIYDSQENTLLTQINQKETPVSLDLQIITNMKLDNEYNVLFKINSPNTSNESFHDIVLCIDTSGSMNSFADKPGIERTNLSVLDILKFCANVIIESGNIKQRIGIVKFSNEGTIVKPLTILSEMGKKELKLAIDLLSANGQTNLYDGIIKSWSLFESSTCNKKSIILFTDGEPNMEPPRGYIQQLQNIKDKKYNGKYISDINIYTYGNNVNSELSDNISKETNGIYGFIPDSILMGDLLIHKIAALRSTKVKNAILKIEFENINSIYISESINHKFISDNLLMINVGDILDESSRNFVLKIKTNESTIPKIYASLEYEDIKVEQTNVNIDNDSLDIIYNELRQEAVIVLSDIMTNTNEGNYNNADIIFNNFISKLVDSDLRITNLKNTFNEQIKLSYMNEYYNKWGKHYLLSLRRALQLEQCNNYKDKCVQHFGGSMFNKILDEADDIFTSLPPPKVSKTLYPTPYGSTQITTPINMNNYISRNNPCFHGLSKVLMYDSSLKNVNEIQKGDFVKLGNNKKGIIECVIKTILNNDIIMLSLNDDLHITQYHPVKVNNQWFFPQDLNYKKICKLECYEIFSFILEKDDNNSRCYESGIIIGNYECATLGHGISGDIIGHPFFGTDLVINNLKKSLTYQSGIVILQQNSMIRNELTNLVEKIII